jgi:hypothetical protein
MFINNLFQKLKITLYQQETKLQMYNQFSILFHQKIIIIQQYIWMKKIEKNLFI